MKKPFKISLTGSISILVISLSPGNENSFGRKKKILVVIDLFNNYPLGILGLNTLSNVEQPDPDARASIRCRNYYGSCKRHLETSLNEQATRHLLGDQWREVFISQVSTNAQEIREPVRTQFGAIYYQRKVCVQTRANKLSTLSHT